MPGPALSRCSKIRHRRHAQLLDHLVGAYQDGGGNSKSESLYGLGIECQFELRGLLDGQVGRLSAFEKS